MKLSLPIAGVDEVLVLAEALDAAARTHRTAAIGAAEALDQDRRDGEAIAPGAADLVLGALARAGVLERLGNAARSAYTAATTVPAAAAAAPPAPVQTATPVFMPPVPPVAAATALDPELEQVDIFAPGAIT
jgi:hypothetical protein